MTERQRKYLKIFVNHALAIGAILVLTFAQIDARISPFAIAFLFACLYLPVNKISVAVCAFLFSLFTMSGREDIFSALFACGLFVALAFALPLLRKKYGDKKKWKKYGGEYIVIFFLYIVSNALDIWFSLPDLDELYKAIISALVGAVFLAACIVFIKAARTRQAKIPWTIDQKICLGVFACVLALGLCAFESPYFSIHKLVTVFIILACSALSFPKETLIIAICMGLGQAFVELDLIYVAAYALIAVAAVAFKTRDRVFAAIAVLVTDVVLWFYFGVYQSAFFYSMLPTVVACILVLVLPAALVKYIDFSKASINGYLVSKNTINKNRAGIYGRLNNLSGVFNEMQHIYKGLVQGSVPAEESAKMIATNIMENVCDSCPNKRTCMREGVGAVEVESGMQKLAYIGLQRGAVNFLDMPSSLSMKCTRLNSVLSISNNLVDQVKVREKSRQSLDASKVLIAGLLAGISKLCKTFADDVCASVVFDNEKATQIKDGLLQVGVVASDCLITKNNTGEYNVSVLVPRAQTTNRAMERVISKVCGHNMQVDSIDDSETAGFAIVSVKSAPRFALTFGVAQVSKDFNQKNGDTFSFLKITGDKTMMALCDGMGAGERANAASVLALSLVENFYKAGFPNEIIMTSVNQLLTITQQEVFSALDIAVFNLTDGCANFIKVGAADGFIKRVRDVEVVEAGSLPLGIVEEMTPKITRAHLSAGDMVVLCSDGVAESFGDRVLLANFINNLTAENPQEIADEIIGECLNRTDKIAIDDCTVTVARVNER